MDGKLIATIQITVTGLFLWSLAAYASAGNGVLIRSHAEASSSSQQTLKLIREGKRLDLSNRRYSSVD